VITTLLVANRGEIARRIFETAQGRGIRCVAVFVDADAAAPHVTAADEAVRVPSYLDGAAIVAAAQATGADAVHPGYGFLSENAAFAADVIAAGITWVGPSPEVIEAMGDKIAAKRAAVEAGVPTLDSGDDVPFPVLVKAAAGGGGKGMRIVERPEDLDEAVAAARREALSAFGDDRVFLERYVARSRHIEIQILGDTHGNVVHLGERECSIQRRHQKIVEESPSPIVDEEMRRAMGEAALKLARRIGYTSAGTVEFLVDDDTRQFFFLEVNTRLQVEHPVTEEVTFLDLVEEQLRIAEGEELGFDTDDVHRSGHAIEVRLYAEDATNHSFLPATGTLAAYEEPFEPSVRWDSGVQQGTVVGTSFDPMLAKVIARGQTREQAAAILATALENLHVGGVVTNRDFLVNVLRSPAFLAGDTTTDFIERVQPATTAPLDVERLAVVAALWVQADNRARADVLPTIPSGWRNARLPAQSVKLAHGDTEIEVRYSRNRDGSFTVNGTSTAIVHGWKRDAIDVEVDGSRRVCQVTGAGDHLYVQALRTTVDFRIVPRFEVPGMTAPEGGFVAPMPGVVLDVRVQPGDHVSAGQTLVVLEAMKMEHHMKAPADGVVAEVRVQQGEQVENGALLLVFESHEEHEERAE
jgi:propionyl-CoA carboxylase alpha chain